MRNLFVEKWRSLVKVRPIGWCRTVRYGSLDLTRSESMLATNFTFVVNLLSPELCRSRAENSLYSVHCSIEGCLQLIENTRLRGRVDDGRGC